MTLEEMKRIADARTKGFSFYMSQYNGGIFIRNVNQEADYEFIAMVEARWDRIIHLLEIAKNLHMGNTMPEFSVYRRKFEEAFNELEKS